MANRATIQNLNSNLMHAPWYLLDGNLYSPNIQADRSLGPHLFPTIPNQPPLPGRNLNPRRNLNLNPSRVPRRAAVPRAGSSAVGITGTGPTAAGRAPSALRRTSGTRIASPRALDRAGDALSKRRKTWRRVVLAWGKEGESLRRGAAIVRSCPYHWCHALAMVFIRLKSQLDAALCAIAPMCVSVCVRGWSKRFPLKVYCTSKPIIMCSN